MRRLEGEGRHRPEPEYAGLLRRVDLFSRLDRLALAQLAAHLEVREVQDGCTVLSPGEPGDALYVVSRGCFGVFTPSEGNIAAVRVATARPAEYFGEVALITGESGRTAVRAEGDGQLLRLERTRFLELAKRYPAMATCVIAGLNRSLRAAEERVAQGEVAWATPLEKRVPAPSRSRVLTGVHAAAGQNGDQRADRQPPLAQLKLIAAGSHVSPNGHHRRLPSLKDVAGGAKLARSLPVAGSGVLALAAAVTAGHDPQLGFLLLLAAAVVLWASEVLPPYAVALALVASWLLTGLAKPAEAVAAFGTMGWFFVVAVFGIAAAASRSGLLFRLGLLLVWRMPRSLFWQSGVLMVTGNLLAPILPNNVARASLMAPIALAFADASRLRDREPAAAALGMAAHIGSVGMTFLFLTASQFCILAWGLLPEASRVRFDWVNWFVAAAPLGIFIGGASLVMLGLVLRPGPVSHPSGETVKLQLALLGPPTRSEMTMAAILLSMLAAWILAPALGIDFGTTAILGLLAAVVTGNFGHRAIQDLDWSFLLFYGVALSIAEVAESLGLNEAAAAVIGGQLLMIGASPLFFVLAVGLLHMLVRFLFRPSQSVLLMSLTFIPVAPALGVEPWVVVITVLATAFLWFPPSQSSPFMTACAASEGRLYSPGQAARVNFAYAGITLLGLAAVVPYWHLLGLL